MKKQKQNFVVGACIAIVVLSGLGYLLVDRVAQRRTPITSDSEAQEVAKVPVATTESRAIDYGGIVFWWDSLPDRLAQVSLTTGPESNIHRDDYAGPDACRKCHQQQYDAWLKHPHRTMNAIADETSVVANFSDEQHINYLGGHATFVKQDGKRLMKLERNDVEIVYEVLETIGSRFFQYFIGRLTEGPFPQQHPYRVTNHVLPFGYWIQRESWVPVVHVGPELPDGRRYDPFAPPLDCEESTSFTPYATHCNMCHTTFPLSDNFGRKPSQIAKHTPARLHWSLGKHFQLNHLELWDDRGSPEDVPDEEIDRFPLALMKYEATQHAVTLGISCEACHLGCAQHVVDPKTNPDFHPHSPLLAVQTEAATLNTGRNHQNLNWACARCHVGERPRFAAGMSTWNSVEYSDAMLGSCYSELKCVDCHSPHKATGTEWKRTPQEDDASCIRCHTKFEVASEVTSHTHHPASSAGSRCMNCHMPKINEGINGVVRTHTIFSPTNAAMIEANHPNACNLCHTDRPIDWTLDHLNAWYGAAFDEDAISKSYTQRQSSVAKGWLSSDYEPVRLVAASAVCEVGDLSQRDALLEMLDDPYLVNRQFACVGIEDLFGIHLADFGYEFYMTPTERAPAIELIRRQIIEKADEQK